jgi:DNA-directed RNA polymerase delta subunit
LAKILTKLNYCYERYIIFHKDKNYKNKNKKNQDNTKDVKSDKLDNEKKIEILPNHNNSDDNNEDEDPTNINNSHIPCINSTSYINSELYPLV